MRAMVLAEVGGPLELRDVPVPEPGPGEVLVRVAACGLGLTLIWTKNHRWSAAPRPARVPRVIGHEIAGTVEQLGDGVSSITEGDRVTAYYYLSCGACAMCVAGREDLCDDFGGYIGRQNDGGLADYVCLPAWNLRPVPDGVSDMSAAVAADALATPLHILRARAQLQAGETVLVVGGGGGVGIHAVHLASALGGRALCVDLGQEKLDLARAAGAEWAVDAREADFDEAVRDYTGGRMADVVVEMVGTSSTVAKSFRSLSKVGRLVMVGTYEPDTPLDLKADSLKGEQSILTSRYCTRREVTDALAMVAHGIVRPFIGRTCSLEEADEVLDAVGRKEVPGRAVARIGAHKDRR